MEIEFRVQNIASKEAREALNFLYGSYIVTVKRLSSGQWLIKGER